MGLEVVERIIQKIKVNSMGLKQINQEEVQEEKGEQKKKNLYKCSKCSDTGWILIAQPKMQDLAVKCECMKIKKIRGEWKDSGIKIDMCKYTFRNYKIWNSSSNLAKNTAIAYFSDYESIFNKRQNSILLCGQVGSGKTHLAVAIAINLLETKSKVIYMPYRDVITKVKQNILDSEYYAKTIEKYKTSEVLLIDDLFKGKVSDSDINIIFEIINYRYLNCLPLIISSEFTLEKLLSFDEAVGSRIYEMSKKYIVEIEKDIKNNYRLR